MISRLGDTLSATHDARTLLIRSSSRARSRRPAPRVGGCSRKTARSRSPASPDTGRGAARDRAGGEGENAVLRLYPTEKGFSDEARELAHRLAAQASGRARERRRLHRRVKLQAVTDGLTELANRRQVRGCASRRGAAGGRPLRRIARADRGRPRRLQGAERPPRPPRRRPGPARGRAAVRARPALGHVSRATAARSSRCSCPRPAWRARARSPSGCAGAPAQPVALPGGQTVNVRVSVGFGVAAYPNRPRGSALAALTPRSTGPRAWEKTASRCGWRGHARPPQG